MEIIDIGVEKPSLLVSMWEKLCGAMYAYSDFQDQAKARFKFC